MNFTSWTFRLKNPSQQKNIAQKSQRQSSEKKNALIIFQHNKKNIAIGVKSHKFRISSSGGAFQVIHHCPWRIAALPASQPCAPTQIQLFKIKAECFIQILPIFLNIFQQFFGVEGCCSCWTKNFSSFAKQFNCLFRTPVFGQAVWGDHQPARIQNILAFQEWDLSCHHAYFFSLV